MTEPERNRERLRETPDSARNSPEDRPVGLPDLRRLKAETTVLFGAAEWQAHLGGGFLGCEARDAIQYNWIGDRECWCVLPPLKHDSDYAIRFEAAPFVPYESELRGFSATLGPEPLFKMVVPVGRDLEAASVSLPLSRLLPADGSVPPPESVVEFKWRKLPSPRILVTANGLPLADLCYEPEDILQPREFLLRRELLQPEMVLFFRANYSLTRREIDGTQDDRALSFRFYRLLLYRLLPEAVSI